MRLLESVLEHGVNNIIFSSSCAVYGVPEQLPLTEDHPKNPLSPYGNNKLMIETMLNDVHKAHGLAYVCLRYFNAAGALPEHGLGEQHTPESHLIPLALRAAQTQTPFTIFGTDYQTKDGTCVRDYIHVLDIAHAHLLAVEHLLANKPSDIFNLGTGQGQSVKQIIEACQKIVGQPIITVSAEKRAGDPPQLVADPTHAQNILQWQTHYSELDFILRSAHAFEINQTTTKKATQENLEQT